MGHIITQDGIKADPDKTKAITNMPAPHDKPSILRFIGMVNYLSAYCPNLSHTIRPLTDLTKKDVPFNWSEAKQAAFESTKALVSTAPVLRYFDPTKPVTLQVDASESGLGGALLQMNNDNQLQPVAFTSCTMTDTERRYSQMEKKCLAICNAFAKFRHCLYGHHNIEVHSDHKPMESIMKKPLNRAPARLQRMLSMLNGYHFTLIYKKGTSLHIADTLSRAPLCDKSTNDTTSFEIFRLEMPSEYPQHHLQLRTDTETEILAATKNDPTIQKLYTTIQNGWPEKLQLVAPDIRQFWNFRDELSINNGFIYKGHCIYVHVSLKQSMLQKIHSNHMGATSNTRMAKDVLFWPGMSKDIQDMCSTCDDCAKYQKTAPKQPMQSLPIPSLPWQIVSQDFFELHNRDYLVTVCHFSDWIEVDRLPDTLSATVIECTKAQFARHGIPDICHTDNGPQFISNDYKNFSNTYGFKHTRSAPYYPKGNGRAEAAVKIAKSMLKKCHDFHTALLNYRNTPQQGHTHSPAQRLMSRRTRTTLPTTRDALIPTSVHPNITKQNIIRKRMAAKEIYDRGAGPIHSRPDIGTHVYAKPSTQRRGQTWAYGQIFEKDEHSYTLRTPDNRIIRQNRVHVTPAAAPLKPLAIQTYVNPAPRQKPQPSRIPTSTVPTTLPPRSTSKILQSTTLNTQHR